MHEARGIGSKDLFLVFSILFSLTLVARVLVSGVAYPESNVSILLVLAVLLAALMLISSFAKSSLWRLYRLDSAFLVYFCVVLSFYLFSGRRWLGRDFFIQVSACTIAYFLASRLSGRRQGRICLFTAISAGALLVSLYGLYQYYWGLNETLAMVAEAVRGSERDTPFLSRLYSRAIFSTFFFPNALAGYLIVAIPALGAIFFLDKRDRFAVSLGTYLCVILGVSIAFCFYADLARKPFLLAALILSMAGFITGLIVFNKGGGRFWMSVCCLPLVVLPLWALALTASEGAWIAIFISVIIFSLILLRRYRSAVVIVLILIALVILAVRAEGFSNVLWDSMEVRLEYWRAGLKIWSCRPLLGFGQGSFAHAYARLRGPVSEEGRMAHSIYLRLAAEMGAVGLAAFVCLWVISLFDIGAKARRGNPLCFAVSLSVCAFLLHGAVGVGLSVPATTLTLWTLAGIAVGASPSPSSVRRLPHAFAGICGIIILAVVIFWIVPVIKATGCRKRARELQAAGMWNGARAEILDSLSLEPENPVYWTALAEIVRRGEGDNRALPAFRQAAALGNGIAAYQFRLAACYWRLSEEGSKVEFASFAIEQMTKAIHCNTHDVDYYLLKAFWLEKTGRFREALVTYNRSQDLIAVALLHPRRIRRHTPAEYGRLDVMVKERIAELEGRIKIE